MSLVSSNKVDTNTYELEVAVDAETFEKAIAATYLKNKNKIAVQGFRQGKAPRKMIERLYGEGVFFEDAINSLYPSELATAVESADIVLVDAPEVEVVSVDKATGFVFKAVCTVKPEVEVSDYKGIKVTKTVKTVTEEAVNAELDKMRDRNGRIVTVEDRPAMNGDTVVFDFEGFIDGVAFQGGKAENYTLVLGSGQFIPGFEEQVCGHSTGDEFDVNVSFPEDYHAAEELAGKAAIFKIKLHEIKAKELPALDDEFAKDASDFDTLDELKADLQKKLDEAELKASDAKVENTLVDTVVEKMKAEIPPVMFEHRVDEMVRDFEYRLSSQGLNMETYLQYTGMEMSSFRKTFSEQAEKQVKLRLALEKIVELENIAVSDEDLEAEFAKMAEQYKMELDRVRQMVPAEDLRMDLQVGKAVEFIREAAKIKTVTE